MAGALKPPWISKEDFYHTPFNYCDHWCERCYLTDLCRVFKENQKSREKFIKQGKDPDSWECAFAQIKESLEKTRKLLEKGAAKWGIDLNSVEIQEEEPQPDFTKLSLYKLTRKYSQELARFLGNLRVIPVEADEALVAENAEIISWYHTLIVPKIYRALSSQWEEEREPEDSTWDAKTSAFIAVNSLIAITEAITNLAEQPPLRPLAKRLVRLGKIGVNLARMVNLEFELGRKED